MKSMPYRELIGKLLCVENDTRPEIASAVGTLVLNLQIIWMRYIGKLSYGI
jgi:hypothetical protein